MHPPGRHIIAVYSKDDFDAVSEAMDPWDYLASSTFEEYNSDVAQSLARARTAGYEPETFKIEASDFFDWCERSSTSPSPSEISVRAYINAALKGEQGADAKPDNVVS